MRYFELQDVVARLRLREGEREGEREREGDVRRA